MNWFVFTMYLITFVVICVLAVNLNRRLMLRQKEQVNSLEAREKKLLNLYENLEDMMDSFEAYVEESQKKLEQERKSLSDLVQHVQSTALKMDTQLIQVEKNVESQLQAVMQPVVRKDVISAYQVQMEPDQAETAPAAPEAPAKKPSRQQQIINLYRAGQSVEEIAKEMNIAKGEIVLVLGMEKNTAPV